MGKISHYHHDDMTALPDKYPQKWFKQKPCRSCDTLFEPLAPSHLYCSEVCKNDGLANRYYSQKYGITYKEVKYLLDKQQHLCAICGGPGFKMNKHVEYSLNLDHCHSTGKVRGFLCPNCNRALGLFQDNVDNLQRAIRYLKENS